MRLMTLTTGALLVAALALPAQAQDPATFIGKWKLDPARSMGQVFAPPTRQPTPPPGSRPRPRRGVSPTQPPPATRNAPQGPVEQTLSVKFDKGILQVEQVTGGSKQTVKYALDGSASKAEQYFPPMEEPGDFTITSRWEGSRLVTEGEAEVEFEGATITIRATETRWVEEGGGAMIVETLIRIPGRPNSARRLVYIKE